MCPARPEAPGQARPCQSRPGQARPCSTAWTGFWPGSSLVRPEPSPQALASVIYFFRRDNQNNLPEIKNLPSCKRSVRFFSCDHRVLHRHVTTKMATRIEGNPKATTQRKVLGSSLTIFCLYSLFVKTSIMSSSVFIISLMYTPEFHLCYARNIFEKIMLPGQGLGQARPRPSPSPA
jgi:hypothetical protein